MKEVRQQTILFSLTSVLCAEAQSYWTRCAQVRTLYARALGGGKKWNKKDTAEVNRWREHLTPAAVMDLKLELRMIDEGRVKTTWKVGDLFTVSTTYATREEDAGKAGEGGAEGGGGAGGGGGAQKPAAAPARGASSNPEFLRR